MACFRHLTLLTAALLVAGCHVTTNKNGPGKENVDIGTPFGSMNVQTAKDASGAQTGMTPYPGATVVQKKGDDDGGAANVSMNFGSFHLGVRAVELQTPDPQDKVMAFYRKDMSRYGTVITCQNHTPVGTPVRTTDGLTCNDDGDNKHERRTGGDAAMELRAGSPQHQYIASVKPENGGTDIGLVALDLPGDVKHHDGGDRD